MSTGMAFDPELSARLEAQYTRPAMVLRRAHALELAKPKLCESALDVGCGPGFLTADLAAGVGENGSVVGIGSFAPGRRGVTKEEARAWADDQEALRVSRSFHFSLGQYFFCAER
jgi:SAM-dependent methyltransferase